MKDLKDYRDTSKENLNTLKRYVPVVDRVHGAHHPEFHEVRKQFESLQTKLSRARKYLPELDTEFMRLREITDNYTVPNDVCESYEAVYRMLSELDLAYHA